MHVFVAALRERGPEVVPLCHGGIQVPFQRSDLEKTACGILTPIEGNDVPAATGAIGDGPETDPLQCKLNRPHGVLFANGVLYVADSEAHRIRVLK